MFQMEGIVDRMQDEATGVPVRTVKSFMSKVPSVFTGNLFYSLFFSIQIYIIVPICCPELVTRHKSIFNHLMGVGYKQTFTVIASQCTHSSQLHNTIIQHNSVKF